MPADATLNLIDGVAQQLIHANPGIRFDLAQSASEFEAIYRLRYRVVLEEGWAKAEDYPDGLECDNYDDQAIHIGAWEDNTLVATMRLVFPSLSQALPTESAFDIRIEPYQKIVDCSRAIVAPEYRNHSRELFFGVMGRLWIEARKHGFHEICGAQTKLIIRFFERRGFAIQIIGEAQPYWGQVRYPIKFDIPTTVKNMQKQLTG